MAHPLEERDVPFHNRVEPLVGIRPVAGNPRKELRHQRGMIELFFLVRAQVSLGARHPQNIAMQHHLPVAQRSAVATNQPFQREREEPVDTSIHESIGRAGFPI